MKLHRIRIEQFRKFTAPIEIDGLEPGLNILHGPNEAGKSTIAQALRTLFLERHNTRGEFVHAISPAGVADAAPSIEVDFTLGAEECKVAKTFFQKPRASLMIGGEHWEGGDADDELARRLGFALSARGTSRAETQGIPGLLWVEQGASAELDTPVSNAASSLEERLSSILGDITSTSGGAVAATIQAELGKLRTARTGQPTGVFSEATRKRDEARQQREALQTATDDYRLLSDDLARDIVERDRLECDKPWEALEQQKREAEALKAALEPQQRALEASRESLRQVRARIESLHEQNLIRDSDLRTLATQRKALADAVQSREQAAAIVKRAEQDRNTARAALRAARALYQAAEQRQQHASLQTELGHIRTEIGRIEVILARASQFGTSITALRTQAAASKLSESDLGKLETLDQALRAKHIQRDAIATRIAYRLDAGQRIDAGTLGILEGVGSQHLTAPLTLRIAGLGEIDIAPGGEDIARLSDDVDRLVGELASLCATLGVKDLANAKARNARWQEIEQEIALAEKERDTLLGRHNEAEWRDQLADAQGKSRDQERRLGELPVVEQGVPMNEARRIREDAEAAATTADEHFDRQQQAAVQAELAVGKLQANVDSECQRLEGDEARAAANKRSRELAEALARSETLETQISEAETVLAERKPDSIEADIQRFAQALATVEKQRSALRDRISAARARLETLGAEGLDEKLAAATVAVENLERRVAQYELRADALALLKSSLAAHQDAATQRLYAPLRDRLAHYLGILFPNTMLVIGVAQLRPTALGRGGTALAPEDHSHGTREQLGVLARFAYADLLKQAGQPTLLILDDALVHSDADRRQQMKRILHDAAQRHQILLFTCHPEDWRDAGARAMVDVARLGSPLQP